MGIKEKIAIGAASALVAGTAVAGLAIGAGGVPVNTSLPVISGKPEVGQVLTVSNGTWTNNPTSFGYQWRRCDPTGTDCTTKITNATSSTYVVVAADEGHALAVTVAATNAAGTTKQLSAPTAVVQSVSAIIFEQNFVDPAKPIINTTGDTKGSPQAGNFGQEHTFFNGAGKWFGNYYPKPDGGIHSPLYPLGGVTNYGDLDMNIPSNPGCADAAGTPNQIACTFEAVLLGAIDLGPENGTTTYHGDAFYVPPDGLTGFPDNGWTTQELHFANVFNGAPVRATLFRHHLDLGGDMGACAPNPNPTHCEYHIRAAPSFGCPTGTGTCIPAAKTNVPIIPPGRFVRGKWMSYILGVKWEPNNTGSIDAWWRVQGRAWNHSVSIHNIATIQWLAGNTAGTNATEDGPMVYGSRAGISTHVFEAADIEGQSLQAVMDLMP